MKKRYEELTLRESKRLLDEDYNKLTDLEKDSPGEFIISTDKRRTKSQNAKLHAMIGILAKMDGEDPEHFKAFLKNQLGLYTFTELYTNDSLHTIKVFTKSALMTTKELADFILGVEQWAYHNKEGFTFNKQNLEEYMKNEESKTW